jgi:hypothetical protein
VQEFDSVHKKWSAMKKTIPFPFISSGVAFAVLLLITISVAYAAPMPLRIVVNHQTRQCAHVTTGDECGDVILPPDWEYLDPSLGEKCPDNYTFIDLWPEWTHFKAPFCCSEGHSGSSGDCQDVITQQTKRQCAFVEDIQKCSSLPEGWKTWGQNCPAGFEWTSDMVCSGSESSPVVKATSAAQTVPALTSQLTDTPPANQTQPATPPNARNPLFPCASSGLALIVLCGVVLRRR